MKIIIITGGDETYAELMQGMVRSLSDAGIFSEASLGVLDLGLSAETKSWLKQYNPTMVIPGWDLPVNPELKSSKPYLRALTARPFLPKYFPGYDIYMWMDPDTWLQQKQIFNWYVKIAKTGHIAITPQIDRLYQQSEALFKWRHSRIKEYYGIEGTKLLNYKPYFNSGVFALTANAPHWQAWQKCFVIGLERTNGMTVCDQTSLNWSLWQSNLKVYPMPAICNWICHLAFPIYNHKTNLLHEPLFPHQALGIIHMTHESKNSTTKFLDDKGRQWGVGFRYDSHPELIAPTEAMHA